MRLHFAIFHISDINRHIPFSIFLPIFHMLKPTFEAVPLVFYHLSKYIMPCSNDCFWEAEIDLDGCFEKLNMSLEIQFDNEDSW